MKPERWFRILVLGGAVLGTDCKATPDTGSTGDASADGATGGAGRGGADGGSSGGAGGGGKGGGASTAPGGAAGVAGGAAGGAGGSAGGVGGVGGGAASGAGGAAGGAGAGGGMAGSGGLLECRLDASGHGSAADPCGCPCCWANDCPNTNAACCASFCKAGDQGRGCCGK